MSNSKISNAPQKNFIGPDTAVLQCRLVKDKKTDYYCRRMLKSSNLNHDFVLKKKQFCQLWLLNSGVFGHHAIVASDGINKDKIIDDASPLGSKIANLIPSPVVNSMAKPIGDLTADVIVDYLPIPLSIVAR